MEHIIDKLIGRYERGALSRRDLVATLGAVALTGGAASAATSGFESSAINHVSITVSDLQRSVDFYRRVFNLPVMPGNAGANLVQLGVGKSQHLSIRKGSPVGFDHFAIGIERFNKDAVIADLKLRGAEGLDEPGVGFRVADPDGLKVQLIANAAA